MDHSQCLEREDLSLLQWLKGQIAEDKLNVTLKHDTGKEFYERRESGAKIDYDSCRCKDDCGGNWSVITEIHKNLKRGWLPCESLIRRQEDIYQSRLERLREAKDNLELLGIDMDTRISDATIEKNVTLRPMKQRRYNKYIFRHFHPKRDKERQPEES